MADPRCSHLEGSDVAVPALDATRCTGCGLCALACPCGAITMQDGQPVFACVSCCTHSDDCPVIQVGVHPCELVCPERAISVVFTIGDATGHGSEV